MSTNNIGMNNFSEDQLVDALGNLTTQQYTDLLNRVKVQRKAIKHQKRLAKQKPRRVPKMKVYKITSSMARKLGFKSRRLLLEYIEQNNIDTSKFKNEIDFYPFIEDYINKDKENVKQFTKQMAKQRKPREQHMKMYKITSSMAFKLGFKSRKEFIEYINKKLYLKISSFKNEVEFYQYIENFITEHPPKEVYHPSVEIARKLRFKSRKELLKYLKQNKIDLSEFKTESQFDSYMKVFLRNVNLKSSNQPDEISSNQSQQETEPFVDLFEKGNHLEPIPVNPVTGGEYWSINLPEDPDKEDDINEMVNNHREKYGASNVDKNFKIIYNNNITNYKDIIHTLYDLHKEMTTMYRLLFSFGLVIETRITEEDPATKKNIESFSYDLAKPGTRYFLEENVIIKNKQDFNTKILSILTPDKIIEEESKKLGVSSIKLIGIYSIMMKVTILDFPIGSSLKLPDYIRSSRSIIALEGIEYNLCYWGCLAFAEGARIDRYMKKAVKLFKDYYGPNKSIEKYVGFDFHKELDKYEQFNQKFAINIMSYDEDKSAILIRYSEFNETRTPIYLNLYMDHFSYITNKDKLIKKYMCHTCAKNFKDNKHLDRHQKICSKEQKDVFVKYPQIYEPKRNTIIELAEWFGVNIDFKYDYLIVYDLEAELLKVTEKHGAKTTLTAKHVPMSFSVYDNIPGYSQEYFHDNGNPIKLVETFFLRLDELCEAASKLMLEKMQPLITAIEGYYHEKRRNKYLKDVHDYCESVPIVGFNSGFYDTGIMINNNFMQEILKRDKNPMVIKAGNRYKIIKAGKFLFLDQVQYLAAGTSLDKFMKAFDVGEKKGFFPYEFLDSYDKLDLPYTVLKLTDFDSKLKNIKMKLEDYNWVMNTGKEQGWITIRDLLRWYNNLDVRPFLKACLKQKEFFYPLNLEMYKDGYSLPALSEKIMFSYMFEGFEDFKKVGIQQTDKYTMPNNISEKIPNYKNQDVKANRSLQNYITKEQIKQLITTQSFKCYYCHICLDNNTWSLDRIECDKAHTANNCIIACEHCNKQRKDDLFNKFNRRKVLLRFAKTHPMIYLINEENKEVFYKLKQNITGGASLVFHRYHEAEKTEITRVHYDTDKKDWFYDKRGKTVKKIVGFDSNALYLGGIGDTMLCGKLYWKETSNKKYIVNTIKDKFFGMLEVDIRVPEDKYEYFSQMCPIFKNMEFSQEEAGEYMKEIIKQNSEDPENVKYTKSRKLIASLKGTKLLFKSTMLKWLIEHGCVVDKLYGVIPAEEGRPFKGFMDKVSDERRKGDIELKYAIIAEMWKTVGNSAFGRTGMNKSKHKTVKYCNEMQFNRKKYDNFYYDANVYNDVYEVFSIKKKVKQNIPIQVASSIYNDSKKRMLEFCYDCVDKYLDRSDYQYMEMDTDSAYIALAGDFEDLVKPELKEDFYKNYHKWFPRKDTEENAAYDKRTPCLFKIEFEGIAMVALCSKMYYVVGYGKDKFSCKGMQHCNNKVRTSFLAYKDVLNSGKHNKCTNRGFRFINKEIVTYQTSKIGLSNIYVKGVVMDDGDHIRPLDI